MNQPFAMFPTEYAFIDAIEWFETKREAMDAAYKYGAGAVVYQLKPVADVSLSLRDLEVPE